MKFAILASVLLLATLSPVAQESKSLEAPGVTVLQSKWRKETRPIATDDGVITDQEKQREYEQKLRDTLNDNSVRARAGEPQRSLPVPPRSTQVVFGRDAVRYSYEIKVANNGTKRITKLVWDYVVFDRDTQKRVGNHKFTSEVNIDPGARKKLTGYSTSSPATVVDVSKSGTEEPDQYTERVIINRIEYSDGTVWQRDSR